MKTPALLVKSPSCARTATAQSRAEADASANLLNILA
jgi:hypothetical protein